MLIENKESELINIKNLIDESKCYETVREIRWHNGVSCPHCDSNNVIKNGHSDKHKYSQHYICKNCNKNFGDLSSTVFETHHQPLSTWILCLYFMGLNILNNQISKELDINNYDCQYMTTILREVVFNNKPETLERENPPILGMIQRTGEVMIKMISNVKRVNIEPIISKHVKEKSIIYTYEYNIYDKLENLGYEHKTVCHSKHKYARDEDGDGFCEVHVNTIEGF